MSQLEDHYKTFITERDFAEIAGAGLNWVRLPIAFWAIEVRNDEPFLEKTSWTYVLKAIGWARKYGIRINLDLHTMPGSQNGWNHSGRLGGINWLNGPMGLANAQRALDYIRIIAEFIAQPEYREVVPMFGVVNEPRAPVIGKDAISRLYVFFRCYSVCNVEADDAIYFFFLSSYLQAYDIVQKAGGNTIVSFHEAFAGLDNWSGFLNGAQNVALDYHPYVS
jgi:glucan 1,3-beta-glucosidase